MVSNVLWKFSLLKCAFCRSVYSFDHSIFFPHDFAGRHHRSQCAVYTFKEIWCLLLFSRNTHTLMKCIRFYLFWTGVHAHAVQHWGKWQRIVERGLKVWFFGWSSVNCHLSKAVFNGTFTTRFWFFLSTWIQANIFQSVGFCGGWLLVFFFVSNFVLQFARSF